MRVGYVLVYVALFSFGSYRMYAQEEPPDPLAVIQEAKIDQSSDLVLIARDLDTLPTELFTLTQLKTLSIGNDSVWIPLDNYPMGQVNTFTQIPPEIALLQQLVSLEIDTGSVSVISAEIGQLRNLETLILKDLQLERLPPEIGDLEKLRSLTLRGNLLTELPDEITKLTKLEFLDLGRNSFVAVPPQLRELPALQEVRLDNNAISDAEIDSFDSYLQNRGRIPLIGFVAAFIVAGIMFVGVIAYWRNFKRRTRQNLE